MSRRTIGGGRVLGSGKSIAPAVPPKSPTPLPAHVLSPSASSLSLNSASGTSTPPSSEPQDITSRVSLDHATPDLGAATAAAGDRLVCPICNEDMVTLLQLNRHLDDIHKEIEEQEQDEVKDWFKQQMAKAKKFQPLAVLNQKLKGLDVFESNDEVARSTSAPRNDRVSRSDVGSPAPAPRPAPQIDPDEVVNKQHWQKRSGNDACSDPTCGRRLGPTQYGSVNCRHCGKLFCEEHTMYQMKLSRSAQHEPVHGLWCRVCETCYKSRDGYTDRQGLEHDRMTEFLSMRKDTVGKRMMEVSRLEKRLSRLTQLLANPPEEVVQASNKRWSLTAWGQNDPRKQLEQSIVSWQDDAEVSRCPYCQQDFSQYSFRRHHCRTCGKVVCGDPSTGCSIMLGLNVATRKWISVYCAPYADKYLANLLFNVTEKPPPDNTIALDIRLCKDCNQTLFSHADFVASLSSPPIVAFNRTYQNLLEFEHGIRRLLPNFQKLLQALQDPDSPPSSKQIADASRTRKRLIEAFTQYDTAARRIRDLPSQLPTQLKLQKAIYQNASSFLHLHMLPLKSLPKVLKHATPHGSANPRPGNGVPSTSSPLANGARAPGALASIQYNHVRHNSSSNLSVTSVTSSRISEMEAEEKSLRERLIVLEEQKFMVQEMIADANKRRKFDEVAALAGNVEDLSLEIDQVQKMLDGMDWEGAYATANTGPGGNSLGTLAPSPAIKAVGSSSDGKVKIVDHG